MERGTKSEKKIEYGDGRKRDEKMLPRWLLGWTEGPRDKECRWHQESGKGSETDVLQEPADLF